MAWAAAAEGRSGRGLSTVASVGASAEDGAGAAVAGDIDPLLSQPLLQTLAAVGFGLRALLAVAGGLLFAAAGFLVGLALVVRDFKLGGAIAGPLFCSLLLAMVGLEGALFALSVAAGAALGEEGLLGGDAVEGWCCSSFLAAVFSSFIFFTCE